MTVATPSTASFELTHKIRGEHRDRLAVVYVRQSSLHQVSEHRESTRLQYGLVERAQAMGWTNARVLVIDEDQGMSAASAEHRGGFQRLLSEVALNHVGLILGVEMSRLARSCRDWYHLLELCAWCGTLICDLDGLYDPSLYNDRLLLGLKGTMSEAELHILQQRMLQGSRQKARRGELLTRLPIGYVRGPAGDLELDPDEQVRSTVYQVFDLFDRAGTVTGVLRELRRQHTQIGVRMEGGPDAGRLVWRRPNQSTLRNLLAHPVYAGAYAYGRRGTQPGPAGRRHRHWLPPEQWQVLIRDRVPAYIDWERHQANLDRLAQNRSRHEAKGSIRRGRALLAGLVVCGRCGRRMHTRYAGKASRPRYCCEADKAAYGDAACQGLSVQPLDDEVVRMTLAALQPSAVEVSLRVAQDLQSQRDQAEASWAQRIERARYEAERARRQFDAVEPEHRLVARTLERAWEQTLQTHQQLVEEHRRFREQQPQPLDAEQQARIRRLADDLPALWHAPDTPDQDRKSILRQVIDRVVVQVVDQTQWVEVRIHWAGGDQTHTQLRRPVARLEQLSDWDAIRRTILHLKARGHTARSIADRLNAEGWRATSSGPFTPHSVRTWLSRYGPPPPRRSPAESMRLQPNQWLIPELVRHLGVSYQTLRTWINQGRLDAHQIGGKHGRWVIDADANQLTQLMAKRSPEPHKNVTGGAL